MGIMDESFPSKYANAATFASGARTLTITAAYRAEIGMEGNKEVKPHLEFKELDKLWAVNKTNTKTLCAAFGDDDFEQWIGHTIQLSQGQGSHGGGKTGPVVVLVIPEQAVAAPDADDPIDCPI